MSSIYTKKGDKGEASLFTGEKRKKHSQIFHGIGEVDELNSFIGLAQSDLCDNPGVKDLVDQLLWIQTRLFDVGASLASSSEMFPFSEEHTLKLESWIDTMDQQLPPLTAFILPVGKGGVATLHVARSVCRRAERSLAFLYDENLCPPEVLAFVNRLSDYFFVCARWVGHHLGLKETPVK
eukprot:GCRY01004514.1.p1 GENE.GCRY01004514.1~~GCRY01004514.1.p1  ORF type:complete len:180 (-),score=21.61 GCRY01004514.1:733-1272(-)